MFCFKLNEIKRHLYNSYNEDIKWYKRGIEMTKNNISEFISNLFFDFFFFFGTKATLYPAENVLPFNRK